MGEEKCGERGERIWMGIGGDDVINSDPEFAHSPPAAREGAGRALALHARATARA